MLLPPSPHWQGNQTWGSYLFFMASGLDLATPCGIEEASDCVLVFSAKTMKSRQIEWRHLTIAVPCICWRRQRLRQIQSVIPTCRMGRRAASPVGQ